MGGLLRESGGSPQPPEANGGLGAKPPEARGSGGGAPSARRFLRFFNKNNAFLGMFKLKFLL